MIKCILIDGAEVEGAQSATVYESGVSRDLAMAGAYLDRDPFQQDDPSSVFSDNRGGNWLR